MVRSKADISNHAIRCFLQDVGKFYDEARGLSRFIPSKSQKNEILNFFQYKCCFCNKDIDLENMNQDHLIPMNKESIGLHSWGNVVPCCQECNRKKNRQNWIEYMRKICTTQEFDTRKKKIDAFVHKYKYNPNLHIQDIVNNLYQDVGAVADTLIKLRFTQAEEIIKKLI